MVLPWLGGRNIRFGTRTWTLEGNQPAEHGWFTFRLAGRKIYVQGASEPTPEVLRYTLKGYLVGDWIVPDDARVEPDPAKLTSYAQRVHLVEGGLDRFVRIQAARLFEGGPLIFVGQEMPWGPEEEVLQAFLRRLPNVDHIKNVTPALDAAFRMENWQRSDTERRRAEIERLRREEEERQRREERQRELLQQLGTGEGRRAMAAVDFAEAARAALRIGGAEYIDHRAGYNRREMILRFRFLRRHFECVCDPQTLRIVDAGICLQDHATGERGDNRLTVESLPGVIAQAHQEGKLVVFRHVGGYDDEDD